jgi:hypothetical protein
VDVVARPYRVVETHIYNAVWATSEDEACRRAATEQLDWDDHDLDAGPSNPDEV